MTDLLDLLRTGPRQDPRVRIRHAAFIHDGADIFPIRRDVSAVMPVRQIRLFQIFQMGGYHLLPSPDRVFLRIGHRDRVFVVIEENQVRHPLLDRTV